LSVADDNVERVRAALKAFDVFVGLLDEYVVCDFRWYRLADVSEVLFGRDAVAGALRSFMATFDDYVLEPRELIGAGADVVLVVDERGRGKGSGIDLERRWAWVWSFRDGRIVRMEPHRSRASAMKAAGLAE
jgi:ketosteroid isomerase-like protein